MAETRSGQDLRANRVRRLPERSLAAERPVSAHHVAARLGYRNDGYIQQRFPALCRAIRQKIAAQKIARLAAMKTGLVEALGESPVHTARASEAARVCQHRYAAEPLS